MFALTIVPSAIRELKALPAFYRRLVETAIETQLLHEPFRETRNRKRLSSLVAGFEHEDPLWELRVDAWRIFYDIDDEEQSVTIRAIRQKAMGKTTKEIV